MKASRAVFAAALLGVSCAAFAQPAGIREACRQFVEQRLNDPGSAEWGNYTSWTVVDNRDGTYSVGARFRAKNGFGGLQQAYYTCVIRQRGKNFELVQLSRLM